MERLRGLKEQAKLMMESEDFDPSWYLAQYPDVIGLGMDPAQHYLRWGARMGRNPGPKFDTTYYLRRYQDVARSGVNPFIHFLQYGKKEGRQPNSGTVRLASEIPTDPFAITQNIGKAKRIDLRGIKCTVVLPVYNAHDEALNCIHSVLRHTAIGPVNRLLVLNDSSPDPRVREMLAAFSDIEGVDVVHNPKNLGYTANINEGCRLAGEDDLVFLNSDTIVGPHWLRNLEQAAYQSNEIGTVTAVSNKAGAFSVPEPGTNVLPEGLSVDAAARAVADKVGATTFEVPTGNGFCFYVKRALLRAIGPFDVEAFPRGYGEENDFCMRAIAAGWTNLVAPGVYVFHVRSASFKEEKEALVGAGGEAVRLSHPTYSGAIKAIGTSPTFTRARKEIALALAAAARSPAGFRPRILFVLSTRGGGTPQTNRDLMSAISDVYECYALSCDRNMIEILEATGTDYRILKSWHLADPVTFATHVSYEYDEIVRSILVDMSIDLLHIRHIAWHSLHLPEIARGVGVPVVYSFHDFYTVCPSVNLIDSEGKYYPSGVTENGHNPLWQSDVTALAVTESVLIDWQRRTQQALSLCAAFVTTCQSARDVICTALPEFNKRKTNFHVIPHGRDFDQFMDLAVEEEIGGRNPLRVLIPGNIGLAKGKDLIKQVKQADIHGLIEFHVLGKCNSDLQPWVVHHGSYKREQFGALVSAIHPHIAAVLSIWPETYCHTLTESWACGLPVLGIALGAVAERISRHGGGWLVDADADAIRARLFAIRENRGERREKVEQVREWQRGYGRENTTLKMSERYLALYQSVMSESRALRCARRKRVGFVMKGRFPAVPPTAYVRLVDWKGWFERKYGEPVDFLHWSALLRSELVGYSTVVVQRNAIPANRVGAAIEAIKRNGVRLVFELDDNLFDVPVEVDTDGAYAAYRESLGQLCESADEVHVTNRVLRDICSRHNKNIFVRPNRLLASRWCEPPAVWSQGAPASTVRDHTDILYFGSATHTADLEFAIAAIRLARARGARVALHVVGIPKTREEEEDGIVFRHATPSSRYDRFVPWLRNLAADFDAGIAPLVNRQFAETKSYIKALEYAAMGLPSICSDGLPYSELPHGLADVVKLLPNDVEAWAQALCALPNVTPARRREIRDLVSDFWIDE